MLDGIEVLAVETAPFIYFVEKNTTYVDRMRAIFQHVNEGTIQVITSVITLTEVLVRPIQVGNQHYQQEYEEMLLNTEHIVTRSINPDIARQAAQMRATYHLRTPDALQIATAVQTDCQAFLTNDFALRRVNEIPILVLDELEMDE